MLIIHPNKDKRVVHSFRGESSDKRPSVCFLHVIILLICAFLDPLFSYEVLQVLFIEQCFHYLAVILRDCFWTAKLWFCSAGIA